MTPYSLLAPIYVWSSIDFLFLTYLILFCIDLGLYLSVFSALNSKMFQQTKVEFCCILYHFMFKFKSLYSCIFERNTFGYRIRVPFAYKLGLQAWQWQSVLKQHAPSLTKSSPKLNWGVLQDGVCSVSKCASSQAPFVCLLMVVARMGNARVP